ncbi:MAG: AbrB/MazE/SpoVT family DNA-binding domain-containing protein [Chloroflexi bacterium]|nr:MAG: AbrB/MazE/SpoVT family DNA-binding domain-containing protein [Chloroflexota bacterium]
MTIRTRIIQIGNSQGIRIPKPILEQLGFTEEVELEVLPGQLIVRSIQQPRQEWDEAFKAMAEAGDDQLLDSEPLTLTEWEEGEWEW